MSENIFVAGGAGFIGSNIVKTLAKTAKPRIVVYDVNAKEKRNGNVVSFQGDVFDSERLLAVMRKEEVSKVVDMIGLASIPACRKDPAKSFQLNVASVQNVLEAMRLTDAEHLVFPSTAAVYGDVTDPKVNEDIEAKPTTIYGWHKLAAESLINGYAKDYGIDATILRVFNVYGDFLLEQGVISAFVRMALKGTPLTIYGGGQLRDFVHLNDVVDAFINSIGNTSAFQKVINVGSGVGLSINNIGKMVLESFPNTEIVYEPTQNGEYGIYADVSEMQSLLGCKALDPRVGVRVFIEKTKREQQRAIKASTRVAISG
ncbi:MAG: NAD-dependent epimerase/dehydratase family protein [Candidatus Bathyarchaeota archaeon]|nr:MAG: NAD-dependent epimerase/dehydratase family protein [Candidatus Bathyarchaeota archaeon]